MTNPHVKALVEGEPLELAPGARPCLRCGYCCHKAPCPYGTWDPERQVCTHLTTDQGCARYQEILGRPQEEWWMAPAFGAGCCSPGNTLRQKLAAAQSRRKARGGPGPIKS